ncbi:hypothetical protein [Nonomuraea helvata]|uniref:hypothetical protein n=1 Tax=Nonomuraea helvata TaxID=37484 RepID=UPI003671FB72
MHPGVLTERGHRHDRTTSRPELRASVRAIEVTGPVTWLPSNFINGIGSLHVALT